MQFVLAMFTKFVYKHFPKQIVLQNENDSSFLMQLACVHTIRFSKKNHNANSFWMQYAFNAIRFWRF